MRASLAVLVAALVAGAQAAQAQPVAQYPSSVPPYAVTLPPPLTPGDMASYCVYENRVYSLGSGLCIGRTAYVCVPSPGPATGNRAYWTSKEDQTFARPVCL
jgi:hypothetical protein